MKSVMILGEELLSPKQRFDIIAMLPFPALRFNPKINWGTRASAHAEDMLCDPDPEIRERGAKILSAGKDKSAPARRNEVAAMFCSALIVVRGAKFATAAVRKFRHRNRRIFWFSGSKLVEVEISEHVSDALTRMPKDATWEPDIWAERAAAKKAAAEAFRPTNWAALAEYLQSVQPGVESFRERRAWKFAELIRLQSRAGFDRDFTPVNWSQQADDTDADRTDICEWSKHVVQKHSDADWARRSAEAGC